MNFRVLLVLLSVPVAGTGAGRAADAPLRLVLTAERVDFVSADGRLAGRYHPRDEFKPYVHPLNSPAGHCVSLAQPHDHRHHKGLMYALRTPELNFWEEVSTRPGEQVGRQRHRDFTEVRREGPEIGFTETLSWEPAEGGAPAFEEVRRVSCRREGASYVWSWDTTLTACRDTKLIQSQWSRKTADGRVVNYHGLGIRFCREFAGGTRNNALQLDDGPVQWNRNSKPFDFEGAMGAVVRRATYIGHVDGTWPVPRLGVTLAQEQQNALFVLETPFAFMAMGPSALGEVTLRAGQVLRERYTVTVADLPTTAPR
ncbi:MAG: PmoA family protein [Verrucomicrobia bacterium]|nr:PmoA family protein [Verrucomicrobiota bacterium]